MTRYARSRYKSSATWLQHLHVLATFLPENSHLANITIVVFMSIFLPEIFLYSTWGSWCSIRRGCSFHDCVLVRDFHSNLVPLIMDFSQSTEDWDLIAAEIDPAQSTYDRLAALSNDLRALELELKIFGWWYVANIDSLHSPRFGRPLYQTRNLLTPPKHLKCFLTLRRTGSIK